MLVNHSSQSNRNFSRLIHLLYLDFYDLHSYKDFTSCSRIYLKFYMPDEEDQSKINREQC